MALVFLAACQTEPAQLSIQSTTVTLGQEWAARGESVHADIKGTNLDGARVFVAGIEAAVTEINGSSLDFVVPDEAPAGAQRVEFRLRDQVLLSSLKILGDDAVPGGIIAVLQPGMSEAEVRDLVEPLGFELLEGPRPLGMAEGVCSGDLVRLRATGTTTGKGLHKLEVLTEEGTVMRSDPTSAYDPDTINYLSATGAREAQLFHNLTGAGTVIAVLDTGVNPHPDLNDRLRSDLGYDFVNEDASTEDSFDNPDTLYSPDGHGTAVAVLAAGASMGVAPQAQVFPVKVCDRSGTCFSYDAILGACYTLATTEREFGSLGNLVMNLSFGGETPSPTLDSILDYALQNGVLVAAAAGNQARANSPAHYPAASDLPGLVAVAALESDSALGTSADWHPAPFSNRGDYLDISAPGTDLLGAIPGTNFYVEYSGTSFATALV
ncbi:MAG TPA: S8 family serine peptidase, partial [Trueperaceae bacterium]